jgi:hypothetical protein
VATSAEALHAPVDDGSGQGESGSIFPGAGLVAGRHPHAHPRAEAEPTRRSAMGEREGGRRAPPPPSLPSAVPPVTSSGGGRTGRREGSPPAAVEEVPPESPPKGERRGGRVF